MSCIVRDHGDGLYSSTRSLVEACMTCLDDGTGGFGMEREGTE